MLVTRILGDCPGCGGKKQFGNVSVRGDHVLRGCIRCRYSETVPLPKLRKKILYLDQFFFSKAFRDRDPRFSEAAERIRKVSAMQLLAVPYSSVHKEETHLWRGSDGKNKEELMSFIRATARGHEFAPAHQVELTQILRAFGAFLECKAERFEMFESDVVNREVHEWDDYFRVEIGHYHGDIELHRELKAKAVESLVEIFEEWRMSTNNFEQDVSLECSAAAKGYLESYFEYVKRMACGDYEAYFDSPVMSTVVQSLLRCFSNEMPFDEKLKAIYGFFASSYFAGLPYEWLSSRMFAVLKDMVKRGAFVDREDAIRRLSGFFHDVRHIAIYAPYCDAIVMDRFMANLVADPRISLDSRYEVKVFSLNNWNVFMKWLDQLEMDLAPEHRAGLAAAYP